MAISTFPYDDSDEEGPQSPSGNGFVSQSAFAMNGIPSRYAEEMGVEVQADPSYSDPRKVVTKPRSAYDLWLQGAFKKQDTGTTKEDDISVPPSQHGRIYEKSGWRQRRDRRRKIFAAFICVGTLIILISVVVGLAKKGRDNGSKVSSNKSAQGNQDTLSNTIIFPTLSPVMPPSLSESPSDPTSLETNPVAPVSVPVARPSLPPVSSGNDAASFYPQTVVLSPDEFLSRGDFVKSPNEEYMVGLSDNGSFLLKNREDTVIFSTGASSADRLFLQTDGNLVLKTPLPERLWRSNTHGNHGSFLVVDDGGMVSIEYKGTKIWLHGIPRGAYTDNSHEDLSFPTRGIFYYPWFPATFQVNGAPIKFESDLGRYSSSDPYVARSHIDAMDYAHMDLSIASWWGPDSNLERARLTMMMDESVAMRSRLKWSVYHEDERDFEPAPAAIRKDMDYLKKWFAWHPAWAHVDGRPVIFVFNAGGCDVVRRWMDASNGDWYVVLKLFPKFKDCPRQPDHWVSFSLVVIRFGSQILTQSEAPIWFE